MYSNGPSLCAGSGGSVNPAIGSAMSAGSSAPVALGGEFPGAFLGLFRTVVFRNRD